MGKTSFKNTLNNPYLLFLDCSRSVYEVEKKEHKSEVRLFAKMGLHLLVRTLWVLSLVIALAVAQDDGVLEVPAPETTTVVIDPGKLT